MKAAILILMLIMGSAIRAEEKSMEFKAHVVKMMMTKDKLFRLELLEFAAAYHAEDKFEPCLQQAMKEKAEVILKVSPTTLMVKECTVIEKEKDKNKK